MPEDIIYTDIPKVSCDGGKGALGHPLVYINFAGEKEALCPYCSKKFIVQGNARADAH